MAGLLDYLYDPATYGNGGLLSRLAPSLTTIPQSQGFPQQDQSASFNDRWSALPGAPAPFTPSGRQFDTATFDPQTYAPNKAQPISVGAYQMPRLGNADQYVPQQAMTPPNATPTQGQVPQQPMQAAQPGFLDRLDAGFQSIGNGGSIIGALTGRYSDTANQTQQALIKRGFDPALAKTVVSDPALLRAVLPNIMGLSGKTDDIKEFEYAKQEDPTLTFQKFMSQKKAVSGEYGLQGIWGTKDGKPALVQLGKNGESIESKLPPGFTPAKDPVKIDAGTHFVLVDPQTRQPIATIPKDLAGKEAAEARGKAQGEAQVALPGAVSDAEQTKTKIDQLLLNEGLDSIVGPIDQFRPSWTMGEKGRDALARYNQLKGSAFLSAYGLLKGGGAITEVEGKKAEDAMARLDRAQSEADFRTALKDFRDAIDVGVAKLKAKAGNEGATSAPVASASSNLKAKYGLD